MSCPNLLLMHSLPARILKAKYTRFATLTLDAPIEALSRPYRIAMGEFWQRWRRHLYLRNYKVMFPLLRVYPQLVDVLPRLLC